MSLPTISLPTYSLTLPSTKQVIRFRPFVVKEEKILLMAKEAQNITATLQAIKQIIQACILDPEINVDTFAGFDLEYFFLKLRAISVNNIIELMFQDKEDSKVYTFEVNIDQIEMTENPQHVNKIKVDDQYTLVLRYPPTIFDQDVSKATSETQALFAMLKKTLHKLYDADNIWLFDEFTDEQTTKFLEDLSITAYEEIKMFLETMPTIRHEISYKNTLGHERKIVLQSLFDFFTLV